MSVCPSINNNLQFQYWAGSTQLGCPGHWSVIVIVRLSNCLSIGHWVLQLTTGLGQVGPGLGLGLLGSLGPLAGSLAGSILGRLSNNWPSIAFTGQWVQLGSTGWVNNWVNWGLGSQLGSIGLGLSQSVHHHNWVNGPPLGHTVSSVRAHTVCHYWVVRPISLSVHWVITGPGLAGLTVQSITILSGSSGWAGSMGWARLAGWVRLPTVWVQ